MFANAPIILNIFESCGERMHLLVVWQSAMEVYSKAVAEQSRLIGMVSRAEFELLSRAAEGAREHVQEAKGTLRAHISAHGCESPNGVQRRTMRWHRQNRRRLGAWIPPAYVPSPGSPSSSPTSPL